MPNFRLRRPPFEDTEKIPSRVLVEMGGALGIELALVYANTLLSGF